MFSLPQKQAINAPYMRQRYRQTPSVSSSFLNNSTSNSKVSKILESRNMHYKRQPKIQKFEKKMRHSSVELRPNMLENSICPSIPSNRNDNRPHTSIASYRKSSFSERNITKANPFKICVQNLISPCNESFMRIMKEAKHDKINFKVLDSQFLLEPGKIKELQIPSRRIRSYKNQLTQQEEAKVFQRHKNAYESPKVGEEKNYGRRSLISTRGAKIRKWKQQNLKKEEEMIEPWQIGEENEQDSKQLQ